MAARVAGGLALAWPRTTGGASLHPGGRDSRSVGVDHDVGRPGDPRRGYAQGPDGRGAGAYSPGPRAVAKASGRVNFPKSAAHFFDLTACFFSFFFHFSEVLNGLNALRPLSTFPKPFPKAFSKPSPKPSQHYFREASLNLSLNFSYFFPSVFPWGNTRKKIGEI